MVYRVPKGGFKVPKGGFKMPINGVKWRFLGLNEKRCKRTYYIYIYRKSTCCKKVFFKTNPQGGKPSLRPSRSLRSPSWTEKNKKPFPGIRDAFSLDYWFLVSSVLPDVGNPWGASTGHPAERPDSTKLELFRDFPTETTIFS